MGETLPKRDLGRAELRLMQGELLPLSPLPLPPDGTRAAHLPVASAGGLVCLVVNTPGRTRVRSDIERVTDVFGAKTTSTSARLTEIYCDVPER